MRGSGVGGGLRGPRSGRSAGGPGRGHDRTGDRAGGVESGAVERVAHRRRRSEAGGRLAGQAAVDHVVERLRHLGPLRAHRGRGRGEARHGGRDLGVAAERRVAAERFVHEQAERVDVGARVGGAAVHLLRGEVPRGAHHRAGPGEVVGAGGLGDPEVGDLRRSRRRHQHVCRLHVAVHEPGAVRGVERVGDLLADADHVGHREATLFVDEMAQGGPVDELHHDVRDAVVVAGVVGGDDVGVGEPGRGDGFVAEADSGAVVGGEVGAEDLDRHPAGEHRVVGHPHGGHAATRDRRHEAVAAAENGAGCGQLHGSIVVVSGRPGRSLR